MTPALLDLYNALPSGEFTIHDLRHIASTATLHGRIRLLYKQGKVECVIPQRSTGKTGSVPAVYRKK